MAMEQSGNPAPAGVRTLNRMAVMDIFGKNCSSISSSVTCGYPNQRGEIFFYVLSDAVSNQRPAIIFYQGDEIEKYLARFQGIFMISKNAKYYEPFFGMTEEELKSFIVEFRDNKNLTNHEEEALNLYISLLFSMRGKGPNQVSVRDLTWILSLGAQALQRIIMASSLSGEKKKVFLENLNRIYMAQQSSELSILDKVKTMLIPIRTAYSQHIWKEEEKNRAISILNVIRNRGMIAIRVDGFSNDLFSMLAHEIRLLKESFLLACCELSVKDDTKFAELLDVHSNTQRCPLFVSSSDLSTHFTSASKNTFWSTLTGSLMMVLPCASGDIAEHYQKHIGEYLKRNATKTTHYQRELLHLFPRGVTKGTAETDMLFAKVLAEDFCTGNGCVVRSGNMVYKTNTLIFPYYGLLE